ncbi:MAG: response regulator [Deltaproteobacteria bacterium]|nr:response regulator [Deltaproteobacteria bacterium]MBW2421972.1 response regulator [Deltaproteobacteria bacterium]
MTRRLLVILSVAAVVQTVLLSIFVESPIPALTNGLMIFLYGGGFYLIHRGQARLAGLGLTITVWLHVTVSMYFFAGLQSPALLLFPVCILLGGFVWGLRPAVVIALSSVAVAAGAGWMEASGLLPVTLDDPTPVGILTAFSVCIGLVTAIIASALRNIRSTVAAVAERDLSLAAQNRVLRMESERRERAEERARTLIDQAPVGIGVIDPKWTCIDANGALAQILGAPSPDDLIGRDFRDLAPIGTSPELRENAAALFEEGQTSVGELSWQTRWGRELCARIHLTPVTAASGQIEAGLLLAEDVGPQRSLEAQLLQAQKMEAIGTLAGGVAHDYNNYLAVIHGCTELLALELPDKPRIQDLLSELSEAAQQSASLTRRLLAFSRRQIVEVQHLSLNDVVSSVEKMLRRLLGEDIELETARAPDAGIIEADPGQVEQIIMNLVVNARDAMPGGGKVTIETGNLEVDSDYAELCTDLEPGHYVMLAVSDTGTGLCQEVQSRIFDPFFTTKEEGKGTGLGLSTVLGIVKQCGGSILVYSERGHGSTFKVLFPRVQCDELGEVKEGHGLQEPPRGSERILLVEDEDAVRKVARKQLEQFGYTVLEAGDGERAQEIVAERGGEIDLLISDVMMPRMNGVELATRLRQKLPDLPVLYVSGYAETELLERVHVEEFSDILGKPFGLRSLLQRVRDLLDARNR